MLIKPRHVLAVWRELSAGAPCDIAFFFKLFQNTDYGLFFYQHECGM
jgi:hypothetical protein